MKVKNKFNKQLMLILVLLTLSCNIAGNNNERLTDIGKTVLEWNTATIRSLETQVERYGTVEELYKNRLDAFKVAEKITDAYTPDSGSFRFKFLQLLRQERVDLRDVYIIEYTKSGEQVEHLIYVISPKSDNSAKVDVYRYNFPEWEKERTKKNVRIDFPLDNSDSVRIGQGFNQGELIVSRFVGSKLATSDYYMFATMPDNNIMEKILID